MILSADEKNAITIESPRRKDGDNDKPSKRQSKKDKEEDSIYALLGKDTQRSQRAR